MRDENEGMRDGGEGGGSGAMMGGSCGRRLHGLRLQGARKLSERSQGCYGAAGLSFGVRLAKRGGGRTANPGERTIAAKPQYRCCRALCACEGRSTSATSR